MDVAKVQAVEDGEGKTKAEGEEEEEDEEEAREERKGKGKGGPANTNGEIRRAPQGAAANEAEGVEMKRKEKGKESKTAALLQKTSRARWQLEGGR